MRLIFYYKYLVLLIILSLSLTGYSANIILDKKWQTVLKKTYKQPELVTLKSGAKQTLALYLADASGNPLGGVIILHGRYAHADWPDVIKPLRQRLPNHGWGTLSLQLPILAETKTLKDHSALFTDASNRIQAAIKYLQSKNIRNIALIGYEMGANMAAYFIANNPKANIKTIILISLLSSPVDKNLHSLPLLSSINIPILDIYAFSDHSDILAAAKKRKLLIRQKRNSKPPALYRQLVFDGAMHDYSGHEDRLLKRIRSWLRSKAMGKTINKKKASP